jgi:hypothetical protein
MSEKAYRAFRKVAKAQYDLKRQESYKKLVKLGLWGRIKLAGKILFPKNTKRSGQ